MPPVSPVCGSSTWKTCIQKINPRVISPRFNGAINIDRAGIGHDLTEICLAVNVELDTGRALDPHAHWHADGRRNGEAGVEELDVFAEVYRLLVGEPDEEVEVVELRLHRTQVVAVDDSVTH